MNLCITGAGGLIGRSLLSMLKSREGIALTAVDRVLPRSHEHQYYSKGVAWRKADLSIPEDCARIIENQDVIIHLAHTNTPITSDTNMVSDAASNLIPNLHLLKAIQDAQTRPHIIYVSSGGAIYGASTENRPFRESDLCMPNNSYGIQKLIAEHYIRLYADRGYLSASVLRISNIYGWILPPDRLQGLIGTTISRALRRQPIRIFGNPDNIRDYIHIEDVKSAILGCMEIRPSGFNLYNIGNGKGYTVTQVIDEIERLIGHQLERQVEHVDYANFLPSWCVLDASKAKTELRWSCQIQLTEGIESILRQTA
jgi:UDP-glucose 4-epimerase